MAKEPAEKEKKVKLPTPLKRDRQAEERNVRNRDMKSRVRTALRGYEEALTGSDAKVRQEKLNEAHSILDKAAQKGVLKKNKVSRTKSRLHARLSA